MALLPSPLRALAMIVAVSSSLLTVFTLTVLLTVAHDAQLVGEEDLDYGTGLWIIGHGHRLDLEARELSILWELNWCNVSGRWHAPSLRTCRPFDKPVVIYLNDLSTPVFSYDPHAFPSQALQDAVRFRTEHLIGVGAGRGYAEQVMLPFDRYTLHAFAAATDPTTNRSVHIARVVVERPLGCFVILSQDMDAGKLSSSFENGAVTSRTGSRVLTAEIRRSIIARTLTISLSLVNWGLTTGSVCITALVVSGKMEANNVIAVLPFSMMLTISGVRAIYSDAPLLSTSLDTVGFFVQTVVIALCELMLLRTLSLRRPAFPAA